MTGKIKVVVPKSEINSIEIITKDGQEILLIKDIRESKYRKPLLIKNLESATPNQQHQWIYNKDLCDLYEVDKVQVAKGIYCEKVIKGPQPAIQIGRIRGGNFLMILIENIFALFIMKKLA